MAEELQSFALLIDWFQLMSLVGAINKVNWPSSLKKFFGIAQFFAFEVDVVSLRCVNPHWNFLWDMILQFCLPLAVVALYFLLGLCVEIYRRNKPGLPKIKNKKPEKEHGKSVKDEKGVSERRKSSATLWSCTSGVKASVPASPPFLASLTTPIKRILSRAASLTARNLEKRNVRFTFGDIWRRCLNILEITYLASVQYGFSALRSITVGGETVVAKAPYTIQTTTIIVVGAVGLAVYGVIFTLYLIIQLWLLSPDCPFRKLPKIYKSKEKDPGGFIDTRHRKWLGWLYKDFRMVRRDHSCC
jgi:hypothetical protein